MKHSMQLRMAGGLAALALVVALAGGLGAREQAAASPEVAVPEMNHYVVALVRKGPSWKPAEEAADLEKRHLANIFRLRATGEMLQSGPFEDPDGQLMGMFVFDVATVEEAEELLDSDPAIRAGHFVAQLVPWMSPSPIG